MTNQFASLLSAVSTSSLHDAGPVSDAPLTGTARLLDNVHNLRDLGGLHGRDGKRVRMNRLFRSGNPGMASAADMAWLQTLGLDVVIDFRSTDEKSAEESGFADAFNWLALPMLEGSMNIKELVPRMQAASRQEMLDFMLQLYRDFPIHHRSDFKQFMQEAETGRTMLYHCSAGKDRTGFATFLLLSALGVAPELILANYLESNHWNRRFIQGLLARMASLGIAAEVALPLLEVRPDYLHASVRTIEQEWGSTARYLGEALGVDVARLQAHYLD